MSLPITAVGPLNVLTNPILMVSAAWAGFASARAVAPASQNAVLIFRSLLIICLCHHPNDPPRPGSRTRSVLGPVFLEEVFCARDRRSAASTNRRLPLRTFGSEPLFLHHNSYMPGMARIIVQ